MELYCDSNWMLNRHGRWRGKEKLEETHCVRTSYGLISLIVEVIEKKKNFLKESENP